MKVNLAAVPQDTILTAHMQPAAAGQQLHYCNAANCKPITMWLGGYIGATTW